MSRHYHYVPWADWKNLVPNLESLCCGSFEREKKIFHNRLLQPETFGLRLIELNGGTLVTLRSVVI